MPSRSHEFEKTVAVRILPAGPQPPTTSPDTNIPTRCAPGGTSLPVLRPPLHPGDLGACGGHRVLRVLGRGGMGVIYEAIDTALGRRVALKLMRPELAASDAGRDRFVREARSAAAIRHENVVNVYAVGDDAGTPFLSMELLHGDHLAHLLLQGMPVADVARVGREVAQGLAAAHALGVVHRDIKPANIWIEEPGGRVRLLDFGLARSGGGVEALLPESDAGEPGLTEVGAMLGTPAYMAPEQLSGGHADARTDLFSLGAVLYQMLTGRLPFRGPTLGELTAEICAGAYQPVAELAPDAPPELVRLIDRLLAADPAARPQTAAGVADELLAIGTKLLLAGGGAAVIPLAAAAPESAFAFDDAPPARSRRLKVSAAFALAGTLAAVVAMMVVIGGAKRATQKPAPPPPAPAPEPAKPTGPVFAPLFNGRDLTGWRVAQGTAAGWSVANGTLAGTRTAAVDEVLLTEAKYADFELRLEYRWPQPGGHTVVLLRAGDAKDPLSDALAVNIGDDEGFPAVHGRPIGALYETGLVQGVSFKPPPANRPLGQWNALHVVARGPRIEVRLNGTAMPAAVVPEKWATDPAKAGRLRPAGSIGLVCHWGLIDYRNVAVRPLGE